VPGSSLPIQTGQLSAAKVSLTPPASGLHRPAPKPVALSALGNQADLLGADGQFFKAPHHPLAAANPGIPACNLLDRSSQTGR
jgi:hypothetical protein